MPLARAPSGGPGLLASDFGEPHLRLHGVPGLLAPCRVLPKPKGRLSRGVGRVKDFSAPGFGSLALVGPLAG